ncbi:MAG TPA: hypothetical protein VMT18_00465, partial [Planctomycetota bacterium]|nr:hypothetical protein [Planctomycetota bacterium]
MNARPTPLLLASCMLAGLASAQISATQCDTQDLVPATTLLTWPDLPAEDSAGMLADAQVTLRVENAATSTREHVLLARGNIAGERLDFPIFTGDVTAGGSLTVGLNLDG